MNVASSRAIVLGCLSALIASSAQASPLFNATALTTPGIHPPQVEGADDQGRILLWNGFAPLGSPSYSLFDPKSGGVTPLVTSAASEATSFVPQEISGNGRMVGWLGGQPVLYSDGQYTNLPGWGRGVNDSGQVAYVTGAMGPVENAYIWKDGQSTSVQLPGQESTEISGLNNLGQLAGTAIYNEGGTPTTQPLYFDGQHAIALITPGGTDGAATGINNHGDVIGDYTDAKTGFLTGFVSHNGGSLISLGTLPGVWDIIPQSINDNGQIVGRALKFTSNGGAFYYENGTITDLNKMLSPSSANISITNAYLITNLGQILAVGYIKGETDPRLFLLTPDGQPIPSSPDPLIQVQASPSSVPEPSTLVIFGVIATVIFASQRHPCLGDDQPPGTNL